MSMARHKASGDKPEKVYIVSYGGSHKLYSSKSAAKGVRTREAQYSSRYNDLKIYEGFISGWVEVDG